MFLSAAELKNMLVTCPQEHAGYLPSIAASRCHAGLAQVAAAGTSMALTVTSSSIRQRDLQIATFECVCEGALHDPR